MHPAAAPALRPTPRSPSRGLVCLAASVLLALGMPAWSAPEDDCGPLPASASPAAEAEAAAGASGAILVVPKGADGKLAIDAIELAPGARIEDSRWSPLLCATIARVSGPGSGRALFARLPATASVVDNSVYFSAATASAARVGSDPYRPLQHTLDRLGVDAARAVSEGAGARIALLDSRPQTTHADLARLRVVDPPGVAKLPEATHGTLIAGIVAAQRNNGVGIAGVAPAAEVIAVPVCRPGRSGQPDSCPLYDMLLGLDAAFAEQAQIVNLSLVGPANPALERALSRLDDLGVLVVAAVGNEASDQPRFPAAYPTVIGVGAVDREGKLWAEGNRGAFMEITAPGVEIVSTIPGGYAFADGTSLATAHVSALLALLRSVTDDPVAARRALFQAGHAQPGATATAAAAPRACDALALLGRPCPGTPQRR